MPGFGNSPKSASRVSRTTRRPHPLDCVGNSNEKALEVILAGFPQLASRDGHVVDEQFLFRHQPVQVKPQRGDIFGQVWDRFLERHEHARFAELCSAPNQEFQSEQCLSGTGASTDKSGAAAWQPSSRDFVQTLDAGGCFRQRVVEGGPDFFFCAICFFLASVELRRVGSAGHPRFAGRPNQKEATRSLHHSLLILKSSHIYQGRIMD